MIQGGDLTTTTPSASLLPTLPDENYHHTHDTPGMLSACSDSQQFLITTGATAACLNGQHCVFGKVLDAASLWTVRKLENTPVSGTSPRIALQIVECGEL